MQRPILENVPTWLCREADDLMYVLDHLHELVVKEVHGAGGYGMLVGPAATKAEIAEFREWLKSNPAKYIAQPTLALSTCPTFVESDIAPRHVDLRPYVLSGKNAQSCASTTADAVRWPRGWWVGGWRAPRGRGRGAASVRAHAARA